MADIPVLAVHGIRQLQQGAAPADAAATLAATWQPSLAAGYRAAGLGHITVPRLEVAYYAHLLSADADAEEAQDNPMADIAQLSGPEAALTEALLRAAGVPDPAESQGPATYPIRQALHWLASRRGTSVDVLARVVVALVREMHTYLSHPQVRARARTAVAEAIHLHRPRVLLAHSLGSVVAYEALHAHPAHDVELFVTLGSPLAVPGGVFEALDPAPVEGRGHRPPRVAHWYNLADAGDLVAVPARLGDRFPVDLHDAPVVGALQFHTLSAYLACGLTAAAVAPHAAQPGG